MGEPADARGVPGQCPRHPSMIVTRTRLRFWHHPRMRRVLIGWVCPLVVAGTTSCGAADRGAPAEPGAPVTTAGDIRFSLPTNHRVVAEHRTSDGWGDARVVFEDRGRECGTVHAIAAGATVAATVGCDDHFVEDQAPTRSVALVSTDGRSWTHRDLDGEASGTPGLAPGGGRALWVQGEDLLTWDDGTFGTAPYPTSPSGSTQVVTVDDDGSFLGIGVATSARRCTVEVRTLAEGGPPTARTIVPVAASDALPCEEVGLGLTSPTEVHGDVSGQPGTEFVVRRADPGGWSLAAPPPITAPGLDVYPDDPERAVWNQVTDNTGGDLVALGSSDRRHITVQRYDRMRQRWTRSRVVHVADGPTCRRRDLDSGLLQGATFRLRLVCDGQPIMLVSRTGRAWKAQPSAG